MSRDHTDSPHQLRLPPGQRPGSQRGIYRWYVVSILSAVYALNFLDRQVINILGESI